MSEINKSLAWYMHPNEVVRMMRTRVVDTINPMIDTTPNYSKDPSIGVIIFEDASIPCIDLLLNQLKNVNGISSILIYDNYVNDPKMLSKLAKAYDADVFNSVKRYAKQKFRGSIEEQNCIYEGLKWAALHNIDVLIRMSSSFIPCYKWVDDLKNTILESDGITFSSYCNKSLYPIRTEFFVMNTRAWTNEFTMNHMKFNIENELVVFPEFWLDSMSKQIDFQNFSKKYKRWKDSHYIPQTHSGYVQLKSLLGCCEYDDYDRHDSILWSGYSKKEDYFEKIKSVFGDKYTLEDVKIKDGI